MMVTVVMVIVVMVILCVCVGDGSFFLETERGKEYSNVFRAIRLEHIIVDCCSVSVLETDRIIPASEEWVHGWVGVCVS